MTTSVDIASQAWIEAWLEPVRTGASTMSQRRLKTIQTRRASIEQLREAAIGKGIHLLQLEDDQGRMLIAASPRAFAVIC